MFHKYNKTEPICSEATLNRFVRLFHWLFLVFPYLSSLFHLLNGYYSHYISLLLLFSPVSSRHINSFETCCSPCYLYCLVLLNTSITIYYLKNSNFLFDADYIGLRPFSSMKHIVYRIYSVEFLHPLNCIRKS